jgi:hypothetical protein
MYGGIGGERLLVIVVFQSRTRLCACAEDVMARSAGLIEGALAVGNSLRHGLLRDHCRRDRNGEKEKYETYE